MTDDLRAEQIERHLDRLGAQIGRPLSVVAETASTNDDAKAAAAAGAPHGAVFLADAQTAGRGRGDHTWHSPPGENLYMSVVLRPRVEPALMAPIALIIGVAAASTVERRVASVISEPVGIKWPNDLIVARRKLGGVLVEARLRGAEVSSVVVGVGLNVRTQAFPPSIAARATSLSALGCVDLDRAPLAADLLAAIERAIGLYEQRGLEPFLDELARRDVLRGELVDVGGVRGVGEGIDAAGRLLIRSSDGEIHRAASGEVIVAQRFATDRRA